MAEIRMTPSGKVIWDSQVTSSGLLITAKDAPSDVVELLFGQYPSAELDLIGKGARGRNSAHVHRFGNIALRSIPYAETGHSDLTWLQANLTLAEALKGKKKQEVVVRTPEYFGALISYRGAVFVMSYDGQGRAHPPEGSEIVRSVNKICKDALIEYTGDIHHGVSLDPHTDNLLVPTNDPELPIVKLDAQPLTSFSVR